MKKFKLLTKPTRVRDINFDDLDSENEKVALKSERINNRRLRKLKHQLAV